MAADNIKVAIKVRPLLKKESKLTSHWKIVDNSIQLIDSQFEPFYFDHIFNEDATNEEIFVKTSKPIVDAALRGFNGTIFAYGQTSSGKTYTMLGDDKNPGVMIRAVREIFKEIEKAADLEFLIRVGYIEIYNEKIYDLLDKKNQDLKIQETGTGEVGVNCTYYIIRCEEDMLFHLHNGNKARRIGETIMNERSSRSHAIFRIIIESREFNKPTDETAVQISNLNLVDLAGSERADQTGATGSRLKEGCHINKSLLSLSLVIKNLSENESDKFINYRDSKLTRILQASLGGNALTAIICTIKSTTIEETNSTLSFAMRAKSIKNKPERNEIVSDAAMMKRLAKEISRLQNELEVEKSKNSEFKISQIEMKIKDAELKIVHSHALINDKNQLRRRTWCPSTTQPQVMPNGTSVENGCEDVNDFQAPPPVFMTPLITLRNPPEIIAFEEKFVPVDELKFDLIDNRNVNDLNTPRKNSKFGGKMSLTPINDVRVKYKMLETELDELQTFMTLEKDAELCEAKIQIEVLQKERQELLEIHDSSYENKVRLDRALERCQELESRILELNEKITNLECHQNEYQIEIEEHQQKIKSLLMASKDNESLSFEYEKHKEKSKLREEELVSLLKEREARIESLEKQMRESIQSFDNKTAVVTNENCLNSDQQGRQIDVSNFSTENKKDNITNDQLGSHSNSVASHDIDVTSSEINSTCLDDLRKQLNDYKNILIEKELQLKAIHQEMEIMKSQNKQAVEAHTELSEQMMEYVYENEKLIENCKQYKENLMDSEKVKEEFKSKVERIEKMLKNTPNAQFKCTEIVSEERMTMEDLNDFALQIIDEIIENLPSSGEDDDNEEALERSKSPGTFQVYQTALNQLMSNKKTFMSNANSIENLTELKEQISKYEGLNNELRQRLDKLNLNLGKSETRSSSFVDTTKELESTSEIGSIDSRVGVTFNNNIASENSQLKQKLRSLEDDKSNLEFKLSEMTKSQNGLVSEMQKIESQLAELLNQKTNWDAVISQSEDDISKFKKQVKELEKELTRTRCEKEATNKKLVRVNMDRTEIEVKIDNHMQEITTLEQKNSKLSESLKDFEKLRQEMADQEKCVDLMKQELIDKNVKMEEIELINSKLLENKKVMIDEKQNIKTQLNEKSKQIKELESQVESLNEQKNNLAEALQKKVNEKLEIVTEKNILKEQLENLTVAESSLQASLEQCKVTMSIYENEKSEMRNVQKLLENKMKEHIETNSKLNAEISVIKEDKNEVEEKLKDIQAKLSKVEALNEQLKSNDEKNSSKIIDLMDINNKLEKQVEEMVSSKETVCKTNETIKNENVHLRTSLENTQILIERLKDERNCLQQSLTKAADNLIEVCQERDYLLDLKEQLEKGFEKKLLEECELTMAELTNARSSNLVLIDKMETLASEKDDLKALLNRSVSLTKALEKDVSALGEKIDKLQSCNSELDKKYAQAVSENAQLNVQISEYEDHIAHLQNEVERLQGDIETSMKRHQEQFEKANCKLTKIKEELECQLQQFNRVRKENDELKQELFSKKATPNSMNDSAVKEKEEILKQLHEMQKMHIYKIKQYQQEIQTLRTQIAEMSQQNEAKSCKKTSGEEAEKQKMIKALLGENDELRQTNQNLTVELQETRILSQKERKTKRYSNHDETRSLLWCDSRDICTMTDPTDKLCNCEQFDRDLVEAKRMLLIKDCQINSLRMELKHHPLREECDRLKRMIEEEEVEKREMRKELRKLRLKISELQNITRECDQCLRRSKTIFVDQYSQTLFTEATTSCPDRSKLDPDHVNLLGKYAELKRLCRLRNSRIADLESQLSKKENETTNNRLGGGALNIEDHRSDSISKELTLYKKKYGEAKLVVGFRDKRIQDLEAELSRIKHSH